MNSSDILRLARKAAEGRTANNETEARSLYGVDEEIARFAIYIEQAATAPLLARIAELEVELEKTKAIFAASCNHAAVMELERDAKRWRYAVADGGNQRMNWLDVYDDWDGDGDFADAIDAAIDAAMKEQGHG